MKKLVIIGAIISCLLTFGTAFADSINIDFGSGRGIPPSSYGAASGQAGTWNQIVRGTTSNLLDVSGVPTSVNIVVNASSLGGAGPASNDDQKLLNDNFHSSPAASLTWSVNLSGLVDQPYDVYLYAPTNISVSTGNMTVNGSPIGQLIGDPNGLLIQGTSYEKYNTTVSGGLLTLSGSVSGTSFSFGGLAGMQLVPTIPDDTPMLISQGKPVSGSGYWGDGTNPSESGNVFPFDNVNDGRFDDTGSLGDWSFWLTGDNETGYFVIDLLGLYEISIFQIQNTHNRQHNDRGTKDFHISLSHDGITYETVIQETLASVFGTGNNIPLVSYTIPSTSARYVRFDVDSYYLHSGGINELSVFGEPVTEPSTMPDDTMAPTGAVHAHGNIIWPGNNRMVTVTLEGYVVDELSIARDGGGIGVSSAYLLVDGNEIILRDEDTDLLDDDGSFSVTTEVEAVKGAVINVELYGTDTEPEEAGGPNSGLVDSTFIRVPEDIPLLSPEDEVELSRRTPVAFEWDCESCLADRIEFSAYPDFSRALSLAVESGATSWTPDWKSWFEIKLLGIKGRSVYWRIIGTDPNGYIVQSEIFSFSFRRYFWWR